MNHRELVLSGKKKARFAFLGLPEELQDEIIEGLDGHTLTLEAARDALAERGYKLSHEAVAAYYRAVRRERRLYEAEQEFRRIAADFASQPLEEGFKSLANLMIAMAHVGLADGSIKIKDIDLGKVLAAIHTHPQSADSSVSGGKTSVQDHVDRRGIDKETLQVIREQVYGLG